MADDLDPRIAAAFRALFGGGVNAANERAALEHLLRRFDTGPELSQSLWHQGSAQREYIIDWLRAEYRRGTGAGNETLLNTLRDWYTTGPSQGQKGHPTYVARRLAVTESSFYMQAIDDAFDQELEDAGMIDGYEILLSPDHKHIDECDEHADNGPYDTLEETPAPPFHPFCNCRRRPIILNERQRKRRKDRQRSPTEIARQTGVGIAAGLSAAYLTEAAFSYAASPAGRAMLRALMARFRRRAKRARAASPFTRAAGAVIVTPPAPPLLGTTSKELAIIEREVTRALEEKVIAPGAPLTGKDLDDAFDRMVRHVLKDAIQEAPKHGELVFYPRAGETFTLKEILEQISKARKPTKLIPKDGLPLATKAPEVEKVPLNLARLNERRPVEVRVRDARGTTDPTLGLEPDEVLTRPGAVYQPVEVVDDGQAWIVYYREARDWSNPLPATSADFDGIRVNYITPRQARPRVRRPGDAFRQPDRRYRPETRAVPAVPAEHLDTWNRLFPMPPQEVVERLAFGLDRVHPYYTALHPNISRITFEPRGMVTIAFKAGPLTASRSFWLDPDTGKRVVDHNTFGVASAYRGAGFGTAFLRNSYDLYEAMDVDEIRLHASSGGDNVGAYVWARFGFTPTQEEWDRLRKRSFLYDAWIRDHETLTPEQQQVVQRALANPDPKAIWDIADLPIGRTWLTDRVEWYGGLDLNDETALARFLAYVDRATPSTFVTEQQAARDLAIAQEQRRGPLLLPAPDPTRPLAEAIAPHYTGVAPLDEAIERWTLRTTDTPQALRDRLAQHLPGDLPDRLHITNVRTDDAAVQLLLAAEGVPPDRFNITLEFPPHLPQLILSGAGITGGGIGASVLRAANDLAESLGLSLRVHVPPQDVMRLTRYGFTPSMRSVILEAHMQDLLRDDDDLPENDPDRLAAPDRNVIAAIYDALVDGQGVPYEMISAAAYTSAADILTRIFERETHPLAGVRVHPALDPDLQREILADESALLDYQQSYRDASRRLTAIPPGREKQDIITFPDLTIEPHPISDVIAELKTEWRPATISDFDQDVWGQVTPVTPEAVTVWNDTLGGSGITPRQINAFVNAHLPDDLEPFNLRVAVNTYSSSIALDWKAPWGQMKRTISGSSVSHDLLDISSVSGRGLGKLIFQALLELYREWDLDEIEVGAGLSMGGYAWARFGFIPTDPDSIYEHVAQVFGWDEDRAIEDQVDSEVDSIRQRVEDEVHEDFRERREAAETDVENAELEYQSLRADPDSTAEDVEDAGDRIDDTRQALDNLVEEQDQEVEDRIEAEVDQLRDDYAQDPDLVKQLMSDFLDGVGIHGPLDDPYTLWEIADHHEGQLALAGANWGGYLDLNDSTQTDRLEHYIDFGTHWDERERLMGAVATDAELHERIARRIRSLNELDPNSGIMRLAGIQDVLLHAHNLAMKAPTDAQRLYQSALEHQILAHHVDDLPDDRLAEITAAYPELGVFTPGDVLAQLRAVEVWGNVLPENITAQVTYAHDDQPYPTFQIDATHTNSAGHEEQPLRVAVTSYRDLIDVQLLFSATVGTASQTAELLSTAITLALDLAKRRGVTDINGAPHVNVTIVPAHQDQNTLSQYVELINRLVRGGFIPTASSRLNDQLRQVVDGDTETWATRHPEAAAQLRAYAKAGGDLAFRRALDIPDFVTYLRTSGDHELRRWLQRFTLYDETSLPAYLPPAELRARTLEDLDAGALHPGFGEGLFPPPPIEIPTTTRLDVDLINFEYLSTPRPGLTARTIGDAERITRVTPLAFGPRTRIDHLTERLLTLVPAPPNEELNITIAAAVRGNSPGMEWMISWGTPNTDQRRTFSVQYRREPNGPAALTAGIIRRDEVTVDDLKRNVDIARLLGASRISMPLEDDQYALALIRAGAVPTREGRISFTRLLSILRRDYDEIHPGESVPAELDDLMARVSVDQGDGYASPIRDWLEDPVYMRWLERAITARHPTRHRPPQNAHLIFDLTDPVATSLLKAATDPEVQEYRLNPWRVRPRPEGIRPTAGEPLTQTEYIDLDTPEGAGVDLRGIRPVTVVRDRGTPIVYTLGRNGPLDTDRVIQQMVDTGHLPPRSPTELENMRRSMATPGIESAAAFHVPGIDARDRSTAGIFINTGLLADILPLLPPEPTLDPRDDSRLPTGRWGVSNSILGVTMHELGHAYAAAIFRPDRSFTDEQRSEAKALRRALITHLNSTIMDKYGRIDPATVPSEYPAQALYEAAHGMRSAESALDELVAETFVGIMLDYETIVAELPELVGIVTRVAQFAYDLWGVDETFMPPPGGEIIRSLAGASLRAPRAELAAPAAAPAPDPGPVQQFALEPPPPPPDDGEEEAALDARVTSPAPERTGLLFEPFFRALAGQFAQHIDQSIPNYAANRTASARAILDVFAAARVVDIGASEGQFGNLLATASEGRVRTVNVDPNLAMKEAWQSMSPADGTSYETAAWVEGFYDDDNEMQIPAFKTAEPFDVAHMSMVRQFVTDDGETWYREVRNQLKDDGIFLLNVKVVPDEDERGDWTARESQKDDYKRLSFTEDEITRKAEETLVGMHQLMLTMAQEKAALQASFKHVAVYWESYNFYGFIASDDPQRVTDFLAAHAKRYDPDYPAYQAAANPWRLEPQDPHPRRLYHGTSLKSAVSIQETGLQPSLGDLTKWAHGGDAEEYGLELPELVFLADSDNIDRAVTAMTHHVAAQLGKGYHDVTLEELRHHGALLVVDEYEPDYLYRLEEDGTITTLAGDRLYDDHPHQVEPGDIFTYDAQDVTDYLTGDRLIAYLARYPASAQALRHASVRKRAATIVTQAGEVVELIADRLYHGTSTTVYDPASLTYRRTDDPDRATYYTGDLDEAMEYARIAAEQTGGEPIVLEVDPIGGLYSLDPEAAVDQEALLAEGEFERTSDLFDVFTYQTLSRGAITRVIPVDDASPQLYQRLDLVDIDDLPAEVQADIISVLTERLPRLFTSEAFTRASLLDLIEDILLPVRHAPVGPLYTQVTATRRPSERAVDEYAARLEDPSFEFDPILVSYGRFVDGGHRVMAYQQAGRTTIPVVDIGGILEADPELLEAYLEGDESITLPIARPAASLYVAPADAPKNPEDVADEILSVTMQEGGGTYSLLHNKFHRKTGYGVGHDTAEGRTFVYSVEDFRIYGPEYIAEFVARNRDLLDTGAYYVGTWWEAPTAENGLTGEGRVHLEPSEVIYDRELAIATGRARNQIAIFDFENLTLIETGGTGDEDTRVSEWRMPSYADLHDYQRADIRDAGGEGIVDHARLVRFPLDRVTNLPRPSADFRAEVGHALLIHYSPRPDLDFLMPASRWWVSDSPARIDAHRYAGRHVYVTSIPTSDLYRLPRGARPSDESLQDAGYAGWITNDGTEVMLFNSREATHAGRNTAARTTALTGSNWRQHTHRPPSAAAKPPAVPEIQYRAGEWVAVTHPAALRNAHAAGNTTQLAFVTGPADELDAVLESPQPPPVTSRHYSQPPSAAHALAGLLRRVVGDGAADSEAAYQAAARELGVTPAAGMTPYGPGRLVEGVRVGARIVRLPALLEILKSVLGEVPVRLQPALSLPLLALALGYQALRVDGRYAIMDAEIAETETEAAAIISGTRDQLEEIRTSHPEVSFTYLRYEEKA